VAPIDRNGSFLDIGCANRLLMESVVAWAHERGHRVEPFGLDISAKLASRVRRRLPQWRDRIFVGNALVHDVISPEHGFVVTRVVSCRPEVARA
jgi:hypothetical protein